MADNTTNVGFCGHCGIVRQDTDGKPDSDCLCTAEYEHKVGCRYLAMISCKFEIICDEHNESPCSICDKCNCDEIEGPVANPTGKLRFETKNIGTKYIDAAYS